MKWFMIIPFILLFAFLLSTSSLAQDKKTEMKKIEKTDTKIIDPKQEIQKNTNDTGNKIVSTKPVNTVCPVSGEEVDSKVTVVYKDKTYAFCCKNCLKKFNKDPEKYISKLSEDGKSLKKNKQQ